MMKLNYSRINTWDICPRKYRFQYVDRIPIPPKPVLFVANQIHQALQQYLATPPQQRGEPPLEDVLRRNWARNRQRREAFRDTEEEAEFGRQALSMLQRFLDSPDAHAVPEAVEQMFDIPLEGDVRLNGKVDRLDRGGHGLEVVDYKTGRPKTEDAVRADSQAVIYAFLVGRATGEAVASVTMFYLKDGSKVHVDFDPETLAELEPRLLEYARDIDAEREFAPQPNAICRFCDYLDRCKEGQQFVARAAAAATGGAAELPF